MKSKMFRVELEIEANNYEEVERDMMILQNSARCKSEILDYCIINEDEEPICRIGYNRKEDAFELHVSTNGGETWGMMTSAPCRRSEFNAKDDEPEFIHIGLIQSLKDTIRGGYKVVY